ncbi:MAG TPA: DEAD/DEAH box helicase [Gaiellaceae bacterium]|nr:DEAD/DEAH box helicase [Gaiellaceae bacterium]
MSDQSFAALGLSADTVRALAGRGIETPFQIQALVIPNALRGQDVLAKSPTGSGKTLAFAAPIVERVEADAARPAALVLVPTRELAVQVTEELESLAPTRGLSVTAVYGGVPLRSQANRARDAHVLVATPGRLQDLVDRRLVSLDAISILVLDEADRMLDMGFKPQVDRIVRRLPDSRQTMFFSATLDGAVGELARAYTRHPARFEAELPHEQAPGEIDHHFVPVTADNKVETLVRLLEAERGLALVFVRTKRGADRLAQRLARHGVDAIAMHGDMPQGARERALARFESGKVTTLIATDVAARGLDLEHVTHVINFDPPEDQKAYTHRVGRTGRAGRSGTGVTLVLPEQQADVSRVARLNGHTETFAETGMRVAPARVVYSSRRRNSRWGPSRPRRKI